MTRESIESESPLRKTERMLEEAVLAAGQGQAVLVVMKDRQDAKQAAHVVHTSTPPYVWLTANQNRFVARNGGSLRIVEVGVSLAGWRLQQIFVDHGARAVAANQDWWDELAMRVAPETGA